MPFNYLIIIVNYNDAGLTINCVQSMLAAGAIRERILVINNGTRESNSFPYDGSQNNIRTIDIPENRGYAAALNTGIHCGQEEGTEWFILMNNDIEVEPDFLSSLQEAVENYRDQYIFGPKIVYRDDPDHIWYFRERQILGTILTANRDRGKSRELNLADAVPTDSLSGAALVVHAKVFSDTGIFVERYYLYGEEIDFLWRAKKVGFNLMAVNHAVVRHAVSASTAKTGKTAYYRFRNQSWFYRKFAPKGMLPLLFLITLGKALTHLDLSRRNVNLDPRYTSLSGWKAGWFSSLDKV